MSKKGVPFHTPKGPLGLTERYKRLLDFYYGVSNLNKTDALRRVGYAKPQCAHGVYLMPAVKAEMERREAEVRERYNVSHERVMEELAKIAYSNPLDYTDVDVNEKGEVVINLGKAEASQLAAIGEIVVETYMDGRGENAREVKRIKVKPHNKTQALDLLMRHGGLSKEKIKVEGEVNLIDRIRAGRNRVAAKEEPDGDAG